MKRIIMLPETLTYFIQDNLFHSIQVKPPWFKKKKKKEINTINVNVSQPFNISIKLKALQQQISYWGKVLMF